VIKAILFDMGNVLLFFNARVSAKAFSEASGLSEEEIWEAFFISKMEKEYTRGKISSQEFYEKSTEKFAKKVDYHTFAKLWNEIFTENKEMDGLLARLKTHYPLYLISNTNDLHFEYIKKEFHILKHFKELFPSHLVGHRKPDPKMFEHVLEKIKLKPEETVFIDDMEVFVASARKVGIHGIRFTNVSALEAELKKMDVRL